MTRAESLIRELTARSGNDDVAFLDAVRPLVEKILDAATPEAARVPLLEMLAETFERDVQVRRDLAVARRGWTELMQRLRARLEG